MKVLGILVMASMVPSLLSKRHRFNEVETIRLDYEVDDLSNLVRQTSKNEAISAVMDSLSHNLTTASNHAISQLKSVLMLKNSSTVVDGLRAKIDVFRSGLLNRLQDDLSRLTEEYSSQMGGGPISDEQKYEFSEMVQDKWRDTLSTELVNFEESVLPRWVNSVRHVWKGIELEVMESIGKFKRIILKHLPSTSSKCEIAKSGLMTGIDSMDIVRNSRFGISKRWDIVDASALSLAIGSIIVLAIFAPYFLAILGILFLFDLGACLAIHAIFGLN
jgi:hypothetical protein